MVVLHCLPHQQREKKSYRSRYMMDKVIVETKLFLLGRRIPSLPPGGSPRPTLRSVWISLDQPLLLRKTFLYFFFNNLARCLAPVPSEFIEQNIDWCCCDMCSVVLLVEHWLHTTPDACSGGGGDNIGDENWDAGAVYRSALRLKSGKQVVFALVTLRVSLTLSVHTLPMLSCVSAFYL